MPLARPFEARRITLVDQVALGDSGWSAALSTQPAGLRRLDRRMYSTAPRRDLTLWGAVDALRNYSNILFS